MIVPNVAKELELRLQSVHAHWTSRVDVKHGIVYLEIISGEWDNLPDELKAFIEEHNVIVETFE